MIAIFFDKLMSDACACFGKTMEKFRRRYSKRFVTREAPGETFVQRATFRNFKLISDHLVSVSLSASAAICNKPTPVEATILDVSKLSSCKFYYEEMPPRYGSDRLQVVYEDTDPLLCRIRTNDLYADMSTVKHLLDLSDYPEDHILHKTNKKVPLTMTNELNVKILKAVVCLRSKLYSFDYLGGTKQSAKCLQKSVRKTLHRSFFKNCLISKSTVRSEMTQLK